MTLTHLPVCLSCALTLLAGKKNWEMTCATGKNRPREGEVASNTEEDWGYFERYKAPKGKNGDWIGVSAKGKTFDHFGLPDNPKVIKANADLKADGSPSQLRTNFFDSFDQHFDLADL